MLRRRLEPDFAVTQDLATSERAVLDEAQAAIQCGITKEGLLEHEKVYARKASQAAEGDKLSSKKSKLFDLLDKKKEIEREIAEQQEQEALEQAEEQLRRERAEKLLQEQAEKARAEQLRQEQERLLREQAEQTRLQQLQKAQERLLQEKAEQARLEQLEAKERLLKEQAEQTRLEKERLLQEQAEHARLKKERLHQEQAELSRLEKERLHQEQSEQTRRQKERLHQEQAEQTRLEQLRQVQVAETLVDHSSQATLCAPAPDLKQQAKAALLARSRSLTSLCSEQSTSVGTPPPSQTATQTGTPTSATEPSAKDATRL